MYLTLIRNGRCDFGKAGGVFRLQIDLFRDVEDVLRAGQARAPNSDPAAFCSKYSDRIWLFFLLTIVYRDAQSYQLYQELLKVAPKIAAQLEKRPGELYAFAKLVCQFLPNRDEHLLILG